MPAPLFRPALAGAMLLALAAGGCSGSAKTGASPGASGAGAAGSNLGAAPGASTAQDPPPPPTDQAVVSRPADYLRIRQPWGELTWYTSAQLGNSRTLTTGLAVIKPGQSNPRHYHPNCDEVLHVISGTILHSMENDRTVTMTAGDTVSIPAGVHHNATNVGSDDAVLSIAFSTAHRQVVGE
jgi:quercetin dioxygenase-like cupin family protein